VSRKGSGYEFWIWHQADCLRCASTGQLFEVQPKRRDTSFYALRQWRSRNSPCGIYLLRGTSTYLLERNCAFSVMVARSSLGSPL